MKNYVWRCFAGKTDESGGRSRRAGKAAVYAVAVFLVFGMFFIYVEFFTGHVWDAKVRLNESEKYSQEELSEAVDTLKKELFWKMGGYEFQEVAYRKWIDKSLTEEKQKEMGIGEEEDVVILETKSAVKRDFRPLFSGSVVKGEKDDMEWALARNKKNGKWRVAGALGGG